MSKKALGRGIGALLKDIEDISVQQEGVIQVPLSKIKPNPIQPRKGFHEDSLKELADSIVEKGVIQPILVEAGAGGTYTIIAGERRFRASKLAGQKTIPVIQKKLTPLEKIEIALIENIQREDLTPVEEAMSYRRLAEADNLNQDEIARKVGKNRSTVANSLRLLKLPEEILESLSRGQISAGHARALLSVSNSADQMSLFDQIVREDLSVRQVERLAIDLNRKTKNSVARSTALKRKRYPELEDLEQRLIEALGTKVKILGTVGRGKIEISYFSEDDLNHLIEILE